jgi:hypothetical protein
MNIANKKTLPPLLKVCGKAFAWLHKTGNMKKYNQLSILLLAMVITLSSCELVGDIFKAGFWTAIILIVVVIAIIIWIINRFRR